MCLCLSVCYVCLSVIYKPFILLTVGAQENIPLFSLGPALNPFEGGRKSAVKSCFSEQKPMRIAGVLGNARSVVRTALSSHRWCAQLRYFCHSSVPHQARSDASASVPDAATSPAEPPANCRRKRPRGQLASAALHFTS
ncbi:hypothetical protein AVEN_10632-1 [Araneus ventricosus]|uniref:Uncharacterized protein n=1 Tax=Araneus ventricosus TaxID=182803 RepID=A0A4Y2ISB6_ARAVE|nr:hypothetical protein AVEN_10632-1 [Araneus ventricosus]